MKCCLVLLSFILTIFDDIVVQDSKTFLITEGKQWAVCRHSYRGEFWTETYCLQGDTVINGKTYKIEHAGRNEDLSDMKPSGRYMREENTGIEVPGVNLSTHFYYDQQGRKVANLPQGIYIKNGKKVLIK